MKVVTVIVEYIHYTYIYNFAEYLFSRGLPVILVIPDIFVRFRLSRGLLIDSISTQKQWARVYKSVTYLAFIHSLLHLFPLPTLSPSNNPTPPTPLPPPPPCHQPFSLLLSSLRITTLPPPHHHPMSLSLLTSASPHHLHSHRPLVTLCLTVTD